MTALRRARWAISFADLSLLLLGFFVLLQASDKGRHAVVSGVGSYFGARSSHPTTDIPAQALFAPGEAMLTAQGNARLSAIAREAKAKGQRLEITSFGHDPGARRFDAWDLAAARLGAVARTLRAQGVADADLTIGGLDETLAKTAEIQAGQMIRITTLPRRKPPPSGYGT